MSIIHESSEYVKKYKCPYCESRLSRKDMSFHIRDKHEDFIPEGQTPLQVTFNTVNKKDEPYGNCIMCGMNTKWNEDKGRYERLCGSKKCHNAYVKMTEERLKKARGVSKTEMLSDPEFQEKMLNNRSISGTYKFADGGSVKYVGSYEKNFLEFLDKVMKVQSVDIQSPGPTISYMYKGKEHFWITDFIYLPYKLVFDIKDGGSNPNNREMTEYREKQVAKEKAITKLKTYNYCRLTDNNFSQLLHVMMEIKESLLDFEYEDFDRKYIIKINENSILQEAAEYSLKNKYPVFITLIHTGTAMSNLIKTVTGDEFSHVCISFDPKLEQMYSFGSKKLGSADLGLVNMGYTNEFFKHYKAHYAVYVMYLDKEHYNRMKERLKYFTDHEDEMKYDFPSLIACALQVPTEFRKKYFCSRFVMDVIGAGSDIPKAPSLWTLQQISTLDNISMVNKGNDFGKYDYKVTEKNLGLIKQNKHNKIKLNESGSLYGIPELEKYPMPDEKHVRSAIRFFNYVDEEHEKELAKNIISKMKKYNISPDCVGEKNRLKQYLGENVSKEIKKKKRRVVNESVIHELMGPTTGGMPPATQKPIYIVNRMKNMVFAGIGHGDDHSLYDVRPVISNKDMDNEEINKMIEAGEINVYKYIGPEAYAEVSIIESISTGKFPRSDYERVYPEICTEVDAVAEVTEATMRANIERIKGNSIISLSESFDLVSELFENCNIKCHRDVDGIYIQNSISSVRSKSRESVEQIPYEVLKIVNRGFI